MIVIEISRVEGAIEYVRVRGHARRGRLREKVCMGVATLSRTLMSYVGNGGVLELGRFDLAVPPTVKAQSAAEVVLHGYKMLAKTSPGNVRIEEDSWSQERSLKRTRNAA